MQNDYRTAILAHIEIFKGLDLAQIFATRFPEQPDLTAIPLGHYTAASFISVSLQFVESLEAVLNAPYWHTLTANISGHNEYGQFDVNNTFTQFIQQLQPGQIEQAIQLLDRLVWYAMSSGFFLDEVGRKMVSKTHARFIADQLTESTKRLKIQLDHIKETTDDLATQKQDLNKYTEEKKNELGDIRRGLEEARNHINELQSIMEQATSKNLDVGVIKENAQAVLNELLVQLGVITKTFEEFKTGSEKVKTELGTTLSSSKENLDNSEAQYQQILGYRATIEKYLGYSVDGYLGNKFDDRAEKLNKWLKLWQVAVPVSVVLAIAWVVVVFTCLSTSLGNEWVNLGVNLLKTTPAFILMGFVFGQYGKERNLQEEYAFKSAVAMTINVYAELLAGKDSDANKSRQQLILNALQQVHAQPKLYSDKGGSIISLKAREMRETMGTLNDTLKNLKSS